MFYKCFEMLLLNMQIIHFLIKYNGLPTVCMSKCCLGFTAAHYSLITKDGLKCHICMENM